MILYILYYNMSIESKSISVPAELEQEMLQYMKMIKISKAGGAAAEVGGAAAEHPVAAPASHEFEVDSVIDHSVDSEGNYSFKLKFHGTREGEWIDDENTNCENLIMKYKQIPTVYVFCRVSSKGQIGENHVSLDAQESKLVEMATEKFPGLRIKTYKISASAYKSIPDVLLMIGEAAISGSHIIVYRIDRLSRNIIESLQWIDELSLKNVGIHSFADKKSYKTDRIEFIQSILNSQKESILIGDRVKMSINKRKERGDESLGSVPYGKKLKRTETGKLEIVEDIDALNCIEYIKNSTFNSKKIVEILNKKGLKKRGKKWSRNMVDKYRPRKIRKARV